MYHYRQTLARMRQGESHRQIAASRLMGRRVAALVRAAAAEHRWLDENVPLPDDAALAAVFCFPKRERAAAAQGSSVEPHRERVAR